MTIEKSNEKKLGILFNSPPTWMGGIMYIINLVKVLNCLEEYHKPEIIIFHTPELKKFISDFEYSKIKYIEHKFPSIAKGYFQSWIKRKNIFIDDIIKEFNLDIVFPIRDLPVRSSTKAKVISWFADLQHKYYPEFFKKSALFYRELQLKYILNNADELVVSSQAVKNDFIKLYKLKPKLKVSIYHFLSITNGFTNKSISHLKENYKLPEKYFIVSNQFHKHKNHKVLLLALVKLKKQGIIRHIAMTGKFPEATDSSYIAELHDIINKYSLSNQISFLGIIPRDDQLQLMNYSQAVLQPSLFEGWSTVIEDAISIQVPVIASNISVNIEQLRETGVYFNPNDADELAHILKEYPDRDFSIEPYEDYSKRINNSVNELLGILSNN